MREPKTWDVLVAGGGPVGLMLACELRLHGADVLVLERLTEPDATIKAGSVNVPTLEAFRRRDLLGPIERFQAGMLASVAQMWAEPGKPAPDVSVVRERMRTVGGHFGGLFKLDPTRLDADDPDLDITDANPLAVMPQVELERLLAERAVALGVRIRRGVAVTEIGQDDDGVSVRCGDAAEVVRARYLVGCDGGRSIVRRQAAFDFPGTDPCITGRQAMVTIDHPERLPKGWNRTEVGMVVHGPVPGRILTVEFDGPPADRDLPVTREELETSLRRVSGQDVRITAVRSATRFTDNARQATSYRQGRVLVAGDAAHVHSPFGGQGLNLGIGDAVNLGWKLAAVVRGRAGIDLLDTYTAERHPIAARVLEITRAQVALMRPDPHTNALRDVVSDLIDTHEGNAYFVKLIGGFAQRYDLGGDHPLVGRLMPLLRLADGSTLADHFHDGGFVLLDLSGADRLQGFATGTDLPVKVVAGRAESTRITGLLVRPDGYVAWAREGGTADGLPEALSRWTRTTVNV
ncbi:FAD-dependent monooxygenase [Actinopolymorpha cephalotaxi]|nr:FAD-dependent monooxygenase [Actinopolymorpha cephalotaxi]NYH85985.1 2-polyprenyl-6-methoxyphenol hydroxylase-like FAD-dependent oxidoreductase [Actinopolymorpha cephalotaxi]